MERQSLSVSELNNLIKGLLEQEPSLSNVCVRGELSNYKIYPSGHHYFTLKDSESSLRCVMFKSSAVKLRFRPENGMSVTVYGRVAVYPRDGAYQLYCSAIMPEGAGDLQVAFEQLKAQLASEGLFERSHKKPLPQFPKRIAIITSSAGAAVHDMIRILGHRWPMAQVVLLPVRVQGTEAPPEIAGAIRYANEFKVADLIITGRGGGSMEDLWAFNDERVARAIYDSGLPVISAVGHEPDVTIADFVADARAATPSHAAEMAAPDQAELLQRLGSLQSRLAQAEGRRLSLLRERLEALAAKRVLRDPMVPIQDKALRLDRAQRDLLHAAQQRLTVPRQRLGELAAGLDAMSPLKVLGRGFAMVTYGEGRVLRRALDVPVGAQVTAALAEGRLLCRVEDREAQAGSDHTTEDPAAVGGER